MTMEAVQAFNSEMTSLYEVKPPISKAKMTSITKSAIRAIKFYKHVVQSVEKFIQKCKQEYKIPGIYVIDSIVRQSRHQFGPDKDVFAPRFAKNSLITFYHLYKCPEDEKSKVIRVLNLWQKNNVFPSDAIQPLFDLANPHSEIFKKLDHQMKTTGKITLANNTPVKDERREGRANNGSNGGGENTNLKKTIQQFLRNPPPVQFDRKLLDFDYGSDEDSDAGGEPALNEGAIDSVKALLGNPSLLNHLLSTGDITQQQITQLQQLLPNVTQGSQHQPPPPQQQPGPGQQQFSIPGLGGAHAISTSMSSIGSMPPPSQPFMGAPPPGFPPHMSAIPHNFPSHPPPAMGFGHAPPGIMGLGVPRQSPLEEGEHAGDTDDDVMMIDDLGSKRAVKGRERRRSSRDRRSRSRSGSRGKRGKRRRSRSRSRSRDRRGKRRSRSRDRDDRKKRQDEDKRDFEKQEERKKKGLPPVKEGFLTLCSTTLWVGHLSKLVQQEDLSDTFGTYGEIVSIDLISPRGCAFVCMNRRMDANRALKNLNKFRLHGKQITLAWAPGKGMKDKQWKDYWDVDIGCSYLPIEKVTTQVNIADLEDGGTFDDETLPEWIKSSRAASVNSSGGFPGPGPEAGQPHLLPPGLPGIGHGQHPELLPGMPHIEGLPPPFAPPGVPGGLQGLLGPPGAQLLGGPGPGNILLRPGFPPGGAPLMAAGPPPGFPGFDASQPPPVRLPGVLGVPGPGLLPPGVRPPALGLLGPPPESGAAPMDLEEKDERRDRRDEDRSRDRNRGGRDRDDRRSSGRWQEDRDRDRRGGGRFRDDDRGGRRESRWGRDSEERRDRDPADRPGREEVNNRLQSLAGLTDGPVSLLDMPDIPKPDGAELGNQDNDAMGVQPFGFGGPNNRGGFGHDGSQFGNFDGRGRGGRGRGGWRGRGGDGMFRGGPDNGFRGRGGHGHGGPQGHWGDGPADGNLRGMDNFDDGGFRGRGGRGQRGRGGWEDRGGRGGGRGFGAFGEWDQGNGDQMNGQASAEGFGTWNNEVKEPRRDREQRQRERKSRWGDAEPEETAGSSETNIPELETCDVPPPVTDNTDMDIEAEAPESEVTEPAGMAEPLPQESVPCFPTEPEQLQTEDTSVPPEQGFQSQAQEIAATDIQENNHIHPSVSVQPPQTSDLEDVVENLLPAPETSVEVSEGANPPSERETELNEAVESDI